MINMLVILFLLFRTNVYRSSYCYVDKSILTDNYVSMVLVGTDIEKMVYVGNMSGYGPDCYGCSGYLAYGMYVGNGEIYYDDLEYGKLRIVAGDKSLPFGTVILINNSFRAIVLDRGGAIGFDKKFMFDLLYQNEKIANENGILKNIEFEVLRYGF